MTECHAECEVHMKSLHDDKVKQHLRDRHCLSYSFIALAKRYGREHDSRRAGMVLEQKLSVNPCLQVGGREQANWNTVDLN